MDLKEKVKTILVKTLDLSESEVDFDQAFVTSMGITSVQFVEMLTALENEFDIEIDNDEVVRMHTPNDVVSFLERTVGE